MEIQDPSFVFSSNNSGHTRPEALLVLNLVTPVRIKLPHTVIETEVKEGREEATETKKAS